MIILYYYLIRENIPLKSSMMIVSPVLVLYMTKEDPLRNPPIVLSHVTNSY